MKKLLFLVTSKPAYFISLGVLLISGFIMLLEYGSGTVSYPLHNSHPFWLNVFFINFTFLGDGIFVICLSLFLQYYLKYKKESMAILFAFLLSGIAVQLIKNFFYSSGPTFFLESGEYLFTVDEVTYGGISGLPSGHTATAFALATVFIILNKSNKWQVPMLAIAVLVGYSRIYLAGHLLQDVLTGALIGSLSGIVSVYLAYNNVRSLFTINKKKTSSYEPVYPAVN